MSEFLNTFATPDCVCQLLLVLLLSFHTECLLCSVCCSQCCQLFPLLDQRVEIKNLGFCCRVLSQPGSAWFPIQFSPLFSWSNSRSTSAFASSPEPLLGSVSANHVLLLHPAPHYSQGKKGRGDLNSLSWCFPSHFFSTSIPQVDLHDWYRKPTVLVVLLVFYIRNGGKKQVQSCWIEVNNINRMLIKCQRLLLLFNHDVVVETEFRQYVFNITCWSQAKF